MVHSLLVEREGDFFRGSIDSVRFVVVGFRPAGTTVELHSRRIMFLFYTVAYGVTLFVCMLLSFC